MDDLIVILIMLAFTIIGGIAQAKKKKIQPPIVDSGVKKIKQPDFWETLLGEEEFGKNQVTPYQNKSFDTDYAEEQLKEEVIPEPIVDEVVSTFDKEKIIKQDVLKKEEAVQDQNIDGIMNDFTLKKGIVFAEILNRKYF